MTDSAEFLATVHPYDSLPRDELARVAGSFSRREYPAGTQIYCFGDLLPGLYLIQSGRVQVTDRNGDPVSELGPRNSFGERGLLRDGIATTSARTLEDSVILMLPRDEVMRLIRTQRAFARFFDRGNGPEGRDADVALLKVGELLSNRKPLGCSPDTPIIEAARMMRQAQVSSLGITEGSRLVGLVTIRDMSNRVVAEGRDPHRPVREVMTADPVTLPPSALGYDVLSIMLERRIGHLPVVEDGHFVGMISQTDLTRVQAISSLGLIREVAASDSVANLARITGRIPAAAGAAGAGAAGARGHYPDDHRHRRRGDAPAVGHGPRPVGAGAGQLAVGGLRIAGPAGTNRRQRSGQLPDPGR